MPAIGFAVGGAPAAPPNRERARETGHQDPTWPSKRTHGHPLSERSERPGRPDCSLFLEQYIQVLKVGIAGGLPIHTAQAGRMATATEPPQGLTALNVDNKVRGWVHPWNVLKYTCHRSVRVPSTSFHRDACIPASPC